MFILTAPAKTRRRNAPAARAGSLSRLGAISLGKDRFRHLTELAGELNQLGFFPALERRPLSPKGLDRLDAVESLEHFAVDPEPARSGDVTGLALAVDVSQIEEDRRAVVDKVTRMSKFPVDPGRTGDAGHVSPVVRVSESDVPRAGFPATLKGFVPGGQGFLLS